MEDIKLIELLFARSEQAVAALETSYGGLVRRVARNILPDEEDACECVNDVYLALWNAIPPARPDPLAAFVSRVVRNQALKRRRTNRAAKRDSALSVSLEELSQAIPSPPAEQAWPARALGQAIDRFLGTLSGENRVIFVRRYWFGDPVGEIAGALGLRENAISARLARLRAKLRVFLEQEGFSV